MMGEGKYTEEVAAIRDMYDADAVFVMVVNGAKGTGGTLCARSPKMIEDISQTLVKLASHMRNDADITRKMLSTLQKINPNLN
jgi:hypothetical protein